MATMTRTTSLTGRVEYRLQLSSNSSDFTKKRSATPPSFTDAGIFLVTPTPQEYLLVVPLSLLKQVCDAVRFKYPVKVVRYTAFDMKSNGETNATLLEVHEIEVTAHQDDARYDESWDNALTLSEFQEKEHESETGMFTITATVDAISPVIAVLPSDPFCLMQVYETHDDDDDTYMCMIVVIKGATALTCQAGILPGDEIVLQNVRRQRWTVKSYPNVASRVMVMTDATSVIWNSSVVVEAVPTAPINMVMLQGTVSNIIVSKAGAIHAVELLGDEGRKFVILLSHFPMSTNLQYGLRKGAVVRAIHVHTLLTDSYYGACLRSTLAILQPASWAPTTYLGTCVTMKEAFVPWKYARIRTSCLQQALQLHVKECVNDISCEDLVEALMCLHRQGATSVKKSKRRDQFAEFLDHDGSNVDAVSGCHMSRTNPLCTPILWTISHLKQALLFEELQGRLESWIDDKKGKIQGGTVASMQLRPRELVPSDLLCIVGKISTLSDKTVLLSDNRVSCPISTSAPLPPRIINCDVVAKVNIGVASALCLGSVARSEKSAASRVVNLAAWHKQAPGDGSCTLVSLKGHVFIVSIHVHCETLVKLNQNEILQASISPQRDVNTVKEMLVPTGKKECASFRGILCRQRLRFARIKKGVFRGTTLTLAHCSLPDSSSLDADEISLRQELELKVAVSVPQQNLATLLKAVQKLLSDQSGVLLEEQIHLAAAWWRLSDGSSSALMACGVDEILKGPNDSSKSSRFVPLVLAPTSALEHGNIGYLRFKCDIGEVQATLVDVANIPVDQLSGPSGRFHSLGGQKFLPGMLPRLPLRKVPLNGDVPDGIEQVTLGDLHREICAEIRNCSHRNLAPSMTRYIRDVNFLAVGFCKVHIECSQCFKPLVRSNADKKKMKHASGVVAYTAGPQKSFWETPLRLDGKENAPARGEKRRHSMMCVNQCPIENAAVHWECSGMVDDGTGQAKLYAEREAALALLGMDKSVADAIEAGAWEAENGICFQKTMPPPSFVKQAIQEAQLIARGQRKKRSNQDILRLLMPSVRASYLLHHHCGVIRGSAQAINCFVRCKPIGAFHLNRTEVETFAGQGKTADTVVYSLPSLKLHLVDTA